MLVEKAGNKGGADYIGAVYFGIAALYCIYEFSLKPNYLPPYVIAPLFFSLVVFAFFMALSSIALGLAHLGLVRRFFELAEEREDTEKKGKESAFAGLLYSLLILLIAAILFFSIAPESREELAGGTGMMILGFSVFHAFFVSFPRETEGKKWRRVLREWAHGATVNGIMPGLMAFGAIFGGGILHVLAFGWTDLEAQVWRFLFYFLVFALALAEASHHLGQRRVRKARSIGEATDAAAHPREIAAWPWWATVLGALALAVIVHQPITQFAETLTEQQTALSMLFFSYAGLAYYDFTGKSQELAWEIENGNKFR